MKYLSIVLLLLSFWTKAQRVEFNDPDLSFSFVKPENWVVNDGLTIFVSPEGESSEIPLTFFSITYFEEPIPTEPNENMLDANEIEPSIPSDLIEFKPSKTGKKNFLDQTALWASFYHTQEGIRVKAVSYVLMKFNQRFEMRISAPLQEFGKLESDFQSILESIIIEK